MGKQHAAEQVLRAVGGNDNILSAVHCSTRIRFSLARPELADAEAILRLPGVLTAGELNGEFQIVLGPDVDQLYAALTELPGFVEAAHGRGAASLPAPAQPQAGALPDAPPAKQSLVSRLLATLSALFAPLLPALTAAGLLQAALNLLSFSGLVSEDGAAYRAALALANAPFYFLPFFLAVSAARRRKMDIGLALCFAAALEYPALRTLIPDGSALSLAGITLYWDGFAGSTAPVLLGVWFMSLVYRYALLHSKAEIKTFSVPFLTLAVGGGAALFVLAPLGAGLDLFFDFLAALLDARLPWLSPLIFGIVNPLLVAAGSHYGHVALGLGNLARRGFDATVGPGMLAANLAQSAAAFAVMVTEGKRHRRQAASAGLTALFGITEPALYGCSLRFRYPMAGAMVGGGLGGLLMGLWQVRRYTEGSPGLLTLPGYMTHGNKTNLLFACLAALAAFGTAFAATLLLGLHQKARARAAFHGKTVVYAPLSGTVQPLSKVPDSVFSQGLVGPGCAIEPSGGRLVAPFSGEVKSLTRTSHAIGLASDSGLQMLIHVGINTVYLPEGIFVPQVEAGERVAAGQPLVSYELEAIRASGKPAITPLVFPEGPRPVFTLPAGTEVEAGEPLFAF